MRARTLGFSLWAVAISLVLCAHALALLDRQEAQLYSYWIEATLIVPTFATLGALIVSRRPGNVIGAGSSSSPPSPGGCSSSPASTRPWRSRARQGCRGARMPRGSPP